MINNIHADSVIALHVSYNIYASRLVSDPFSVLFIEQKAFQTKERINVNDASASSV